MADIEEAVNVFPEVPLEKLKRVYQHYDNPSLARIANVLEQAKAQGKVPESDYRGRVDETIPQGEHKLHPELADELEKMGFDPAEAEEGLEAQEEVDRGEWEEKAISTCQTGDIEDVMALYLKLDDLIKQMLKSPTRSNIPDDPDIAMQILGNEIADRIEEVGLEGDPEKIERVFEQVNRIPNEELREGYVELIRPWRRLARSDGTEADKARRWVLEADGEEMVDRIEELRDGREYDINTHQLREIVEDVQERIEETV